AEWPLGCNRSRGFADVEIGFNSDHFPRRVHLNVDRNEDSKRSYYQAPVPRQKRQGPKPIQDETEHKKGGKDHRRGGNHFWMVGGRVNAPWSLLHCRWLLTRPHLCSRFPGIALYHPRTLPPIRAPRKAASFLRQGFLVWEGEFRILPNCEIAGRALPRSQSFDDVSPAPVFGIFPAKMQRCS